VAERLQGCFTIPSVVFPQVLTILPNILKKTSILLLTKEPFFRLCCWVEDDPYQSLTICFAAASLHRRVHCFFTQNILQIYCNSITAIPVRLEESAKAHIRSTHDRLPVANSWNGSFSASNSCSRRAILKAFRWLIVHTLRSRDRLPVSCTSQLLAAPEATWTDLQNYRKLQSADARTCRPVGRERATAITLATCQLCSARHNRWCLIFWWLLARAWKRRGSERRLTTKIPLQDEQRHQQHGEITQDY